MFHQGLHPIDWAVIALYALGIIGVGYYYSSRQADTSAYFIGSGRMPSWVIGLSLFTTLFSTISYLSMPGEMIKHGPAYLFIFLAIPFSYLAVGYWLIPAFMRYRVISAYELLEARLGSGIRTLGASLFIALRLVWMTVLIYMACAAITVVLGLSPDQIIYVILVTGAISVANATLGGLRAVAVMDTMQSFFLMLGALVTLAVVTWQFRGFSWVPTQWEPEWATQPFFTFDPHVRVSVLGVILMNFFWHLSTAGGDQTAIQRYMSTRDARAARNSFLVHSIMGVVVSLVVSAIGFALMAYYRRFPNLLPPGQTTTSYADQLFPLFIANQLPIGICGFVVVALFAAAVSSLDSGVNSITAVISRDFLERHRTPPDNRTQVRRARRLALVIGTVVIALGTQVGNVPGTFLEVTKKTTNIFAAPIFGLFVLALFVKRADGFGAAIGTIYAFFTAVVIAYWDVLTGLAPLSFMWIMPPTLLIQISIAFAIGHRRRAGEAHPCAAGWILSLLPLAAAILAILAVRFTH